MSRYNTNNPVPSNEVKDFSDNAQIVDEIVHSQDPTTKDRFGNDLKTWCGIQDDANEAIANFGYITMDSFEDGNTLTLPNQALRYEATGEYYRWDGAFPVGGKVVPPASTPEASGGVGTGAWLSVGDAILRSMLNGLDGLSIVGGATYAQIRASNVNGDQIKCLGRAANRDGGEGWFFLDESDTTTADDDGTVLIDAVGRRWKRSYDGAKMAAWFGVKAGTEVSSAIQNMLNTGNGGIEVKDGQYNSTTKVTVNHSDSAFPVMGRSSKRFDFTGESMTNTTFNTNGNDFLEFIGNPAGTGQGVHSGMKLGNFTVYGTGNTGVGLRLSNAAYLKAEDLYVVRNNSGIVLTGILTSELNRINSQYNNYGMYINGAANSTANALKINGIFSANSKFGIEGDIGTRINLNNCNFEGNGTQADSGTGGIYLRANEPMSVINISDCYFEANQGIADIQINNMTSSPLIVNINSCTFIRGNSSGGYCTYVIRLLSSGGGRVILNLNGCHFFTQTAFGYTPSSSRPFISGASFMTLNGMDTCYFSENISKSSSTVSTSSVIAGSVTAAGVGTAPAYLTIAKQTTGTYSIDCSFLYGPTTNDFQVVASPKSSGFRVAYAGKPSTTAIRVVTTDSAGNVADADFDFMITRVR